MSESPPVDDVDVFVETVKGVGDFTFRRRNMRWELKTRVEFRRLSEGEQLDEMTTLFIEAIADLKVLIVSGPAGLDRPGARRHGPLRRRHHRQGAQGLERASR
jgi:hypothetical protein